MIQVICSLVLCDLGHLYFITVSVLAAKCLTILCQLEHDFSTSASVLFSLEMPNSRTGANSISTTD